MLKTNKVVLLGRVLNDWTFSHRMINEDFYESKIEVLRESGANDYLPIIVSERLITKKLKKISGVNVYVYGSVRTYNLFDSMNTRLKVFVFVDEIHEVESRDEMIEIIQTNGISLLTNNWVQLEGAICKKSALRNTPGGRRLVDAIIAVNRDFGKSDYIPCIFWGKNGNYVDELKIGTRVQLKGRLQSRVYIKNDRERETYEVSADHVIIVEGEDEDEEFVI